MSQRIRRLVTQLVVSVTPYRKHEKGRFGREMERKLEFLKECQGDQMNIANRVEG